MTSMVSMAKRKTTSLFVQLSPFVNACRFVTTLAAILFLLMHNVPYSGDIQNIVSSSAALAGNGLTNSGSVPPKWDSAKCTVIALATGYGKDVYHRFVGSLRATGYTGHIILGVAPDLSSDAREYLVSNNVTIKVIKMAEKCTYYNHRQYIRDPSTQQKCSDTYPDYKIQWARFPLARDWLLECKDCTDGVMLTDSRDSFFQSDPFQHVTDPSKNQLMLLEEHANQTTEHRLTKIPVQRCRKYTFGDREKAFWNTPTLWWRSLTTGKIEQNAVPKWMVMTSPYIIICTTRVDYPRPFPFLIVQVQFIS